MKDPIARIILAAAVPNVIIEYIISLSTMSRYVASANNQLAWGVCLRGVRLCEQLSFGPNAGKIDALSRW